MSTGAAPDLPPHAYVPGQTPRHDASLFAALHGSVRPGMDAEALARTEAWRAGLHFLRAGYYWEAHEALEPVWMQTAPNSAARHLVQALIQAANAGLKLRMRRPRATLRLFTRRGRDTPHTNRIQSRKPALCCNFGFTDAQRADNMQNECTLCGLAP